LWARHRAADLLAVEIDRDDIVERHLVETDRARLHQEAMRIVRQPHRDVAGHEITLVLAGEERGPHWSVFFRNASVIWSFP